jgi:hypothetical protein
VASQPHTHRFYGASMSVRPQPIGSGWSVTQECEICGAVGEAIVGPWDFKLVGETRPVVCSPCRQCDHAHCHDHWTEEDSGAFVTVRCECECNWSASWDVRT